jgi:polysaccharide biosynthesis/export protein
VNIIWRSLGLLLSGLVLTACTANRSVPELPLADAHILPEYRIGVGDALQINVWRNPELSLAVPVRPDGMISMPLIGDIMASQRTTEQLSRDITKRLQEYVRSPQVTVIVTNPSSADFQRRVRITGAVRAPQSIPFREGMTVLDLVLIAGGVNEFASPNRARLFRQVDGELKVYPVRLNDLIEKGDVKFNYPLQPFDILTVPERAF